MHFWLARYIERAENLARILDADDTFARDSKGGQNWFSIVRLYAGEGRFFDAHTPGLSGNRPAIRCHIFGEPDLHRQHGPVGARERARSAADYFDRDVGAAERVSQLGREDVCGGHSAGTTCGLFSRIKEACQTHTGVTEGTFHRDQGWYDYQVGRLSNARIKPPVCST